MIGSTTYGNETEREREEVKISFLATFFLSFSLSMVSDDAIRQHKRQDIYIFICVCMPRGY